MSDDSRNVLLETNGLSKHFGGIVAVDDVDLDIYRGEVRGIIGPNGAGKSTLFKLLAGHHTPTSGSITFDGEDITHLEPHNRVHRGLSIKFQDVSVYPELSLDENLRIPLQMFVDDHDEVERRTDELLEEIGLEDKRTQDAELLTHVEKQWLEVALAYAVDPSLLLLDEPTAGMTVAESNRTIDLIRSIVEDETTVVVIEHDMDVIREVSDLITVLHNGAIFMHGTADEIEANEDVKDIYLGRD